jgi:hypothetical protein
VLGREVEGTTGKIDQMHLHACMLKNLFGLGVEEVNAPVVQVGPRPYYLVDQMNDSPLKSQLCKSVGTEDV